MPGEGRRMTKLQREWCRRVNAGVNGTDALRQLGYTDPTAKQKAWKLRHLPHIQAELERLAKQAAEDAALTALKVLTDLDEVRARCMQAVPVLDSEGNETGEYKFDATAALKAIELQGKHLRMWQEKVAHEHSAPGGGPIQITKVERVIVKPENRNG